MYPCIYLFSSQTGRCQLPAIKPLGRMGRMRDIYPRVEPYIRQPAPHRITAGVPVAGYPSLSGPPKIYPLSGATHS